VRANNALNLHSYSVILILIIKYLGVIIYVVMYYYLKEQYYYNKMKDEKVIDAVAIRILDLGLEGEYSYNTDEPLTNKQKNLKRDVKKTLTKWFLEDNRRTCVKVIHDALINLDCNTKLRFENKELKKKLEFHADKEQSYKDYTSTLYRDELEQQLREELDQDREEAIKSSRKVNRRLMDCIASLENQISVHKSNVSTEEYNRIRAQNLQMNEIILDLRKKASLSKKAMEIEKILKLDKSSSEDSICEMISECSD